MRGWKKRRNIKKREERREGAERFVVVVLFFSGDARRQITLLGNIYRAKFILIWPTINNQIDSPVNVLKAEVHSFRRQSSLEALFIKALLLLKSGR